MSTNTKRHSTKPGRVIPNSLREAVSERGRRPHNLWWGYSYKERKHFHCASDVALCHAVLLELDCSVASYALEQPELTTLIDGEYVTTRFDAEVFRKDGAIEWHEVKYQLDDDAAQSGQIRAQVQLSRDRGVPYRLFTWKDFVSQTIRIWNGLRMLQTVAMTADEVLAPSRLSIVARLGRGPCALGEIRTLDRHDQALNLAAAFVLILEGAAHADLDETHLSDTTLLAMEREP